MGRAAAVVANGRQQGRRRRGGGGPQLQGRGLQPLSSALTRVCVAAAGGGLTVIAGKGFHSIYFKAVREGGSESLRGRLHPQPLHSQVCPLLQGGVQPHQAMTVAATLGLPHTPAYSSCGLLDLIAHEHLAPIR